MGPKRAVRILIQSRQYKSNPDRNTGNKQRTRTDVDEQEPAQKHTERTTVNTQKQTRSVLSIGISPFLASNSVHLPLHRPIECPWVSTEICCCPPVLLSKKIEKIQCAGPFVAVEIVAFSLFRLMKPFTRPTECHATFFSNASTRR